MTPNFFQGAHLIKNLGRFYRVPFKSILRVQIKQAIVSNLTFINPFFRYQGSYSPVVETEYDDETDSNYEDYSSKTTTTNSGATRYEAGSYFDQSQSENAGSDYNQNQGSSYGTGRNSGSGKEFCTTFCFAYTLGLLALPL